MASMEAAPSFPLGPALAGGAPKLDMLGIGMPGMPPSMAEPPSPPSSPATAACFTMKPSSPTTFPASPPISAVSLEMQERSPGCSACLCRNAMIIERTNSLDSAFSLAWSAADSMGISPPPPGPIMPGGIMPPGIPPICRRRCSDASPKLSAMADIGMEKAATTTAATEHRGTCRCGHRGARRILEAPGGPRRGRFECCLA
mmetsp:Transcript_41667/g.118029  ORF Transcript_41667/g.118029 Transcript_41667/m.118029 type:complete len:201 (-) Transcript_41667:7-609(-)